QIINEAKEPYKTLFATVWYTGLRSGELFALTVSDLDFERKTIRVNKSADDKTREIRHAKTQKTVATLPMPSALEVLLRTYLRHTYNATVRVDTFPSRPSARPVKREGLVQLVLRPIQKRLGLPLRGGLHAFRHGHATELADASVPVTVLQQQMRHTDVKTT